MMNTIEWVATCASILTIVSFFFNLSQFVHSRRTRAEVFLRLQGLYSSFFDIAALVEIALPDSSRNAEKALHEIRGLADAARHDINATARIVTGKVPFYQPPGGFPHFGAETEGQDPHEIIAHKAQHFHRKPEPPETDA